MIPAPKPTERMAAAAPAIAARLPHEVFFDVGSLTCAAGATASSLSCSSAEDCATDSRGIPANALVLS